MGLLAGALVAAAYAPRPRFDAESTEGENPRDGHGFTRVIAPGAVNFVRPIPPPISSLTCTAICAVVDRRIWDVSRGQRSPKLIFSPQRQGVGG